MSGNDKPFSCEGWREIGCEMVTHRVLHEGRALNEKRTASPYSLVPEAKFLERDAERQDSFLDPDHEFHDRLRVA